MQASSLNLNRKNNNQPMSMGSMGIMMLIFAVILIGFNYWHAMRCVESNGMGDLEDYAKSIDKRVLELESKSLQNNILMENLLKEVQNRLATIDVEEMHKLVESSKDEAVRIALSLAKHRAPPMPEYKIDDKYRDPNELNNLIDDIFQDQVNKEEENSAEFAGFEGEQMLFKDQGDDQYIDDINEKKEGGSGMEIPDEEKKTICRDWKNSYSVVTGVSWGSLPYKLQKEWKRYDCDYYLIN